MPLSTPSASTARTPTHTSNRTMAMGHTKSSEVTAVASTWRKSLLKWASGSSPQTLPMDFHEYMKAQAMITE